MSKGCIVLILEIAAGIFQLGATVCRAFAEYVANN